jgi:hypothetical protein
MSKILYDAKPGDPVQRYLGGEIAMRLFVVGITDDLLFCALNPNCPPIDSMSNPVWCFSRITGEEIDIEIGSVPGHAHSIIKPI